MRLVYGGAVLSAGARRPVYSARVMPTTPTAPERRRIELAPVLGSLLVGALAVLVGWAVWGFSYDDAYITYRYAAHFAAGDGLVFNPGERVLGTTAPGYAVLLGVLSWVAGSPVAWGTILGLLGLAAAALSPWLLPADRRPPTAWIVLWGASLFLARWLVELLGAETLPVLGAACLAGVLALGPPRPSTRRLAAAGLLAALAASLRFDAVFVCGLLGLALWLRRRCFPWPFFVGTLPAGLVVLAVTAYYGSPLPQTLAGKRGEFADRTIASYTGAEWFWLRRAFGDGGAVVLLASAALGCLWLLRRGAWRHPLVLVATAWVVAVEAFYRLVQVSFSYWYHVMTVALLLGLAAWGAVGVPWPRTRLRPAIRWTLGTFVLLPILWTSTAFLASSFREPPDPRWRIYRDVGLFLDRETEPATVAMVEIGVAGYHASRHPVLDLVGLVSPVAAEHGAAEALRRRSPRYVVDASLFHGRFPVLAELGPPAWRLLRTFEDPASGRGVVRVWAASPPAESPKTDD